MKTIQELDLLYDISLELLQNYSIKSHIGNILNYFGDKLNILKGIINILDINTGKIQIQSAYGLTIDEMSRGQYKIGEGITGKVVSTGESIIVENISKEPLFLHRTKTTFDTNIREISFICVPIKIKDDIIGTFSIYLQKQNITTLNIYMKIITIVAKMLSHHIEFDRQVKAEHELNIKLKRELYEQFRPDNMIGNSSKMLNVYELINQVSTKNTTVLIRGESGTGKELVAKAIHYNSNMKNGPFVKINCSAIPDNLLESEMFGHEKGSFTGADSIKIGKFETANNGTIFLDEIGEMNTTLQAKLLRVIQEKEFERVGGIKPIKVNVRILAATNSDLETAIENGTFRSDLYYRLNVFPIFLPSLKERSSDIILLSDYFIEKYSKNYEKEVKRISTPAIDMLMSYHWPGNVRELENCIERAVILSEDNVIHSYHLPPSLQTADETNTTFKDDFNTAVETYERELIIEALKDTHGNIKLASKQLGTTQRIIQYKSKKLGIDYKHYRKK